MTDKDITIGLKATGGDQAAAEVRKVETAVEGLDSSTSGSGDGIDDLNAKLDELRGRAEVLKQPMEEAGASASMMDENVSKIARVQKAQAIGQLAASIGQIGEKMAEVSGEVAEFDAELAVTLKNTGENIQEVSAAVQTMAIGFAVGGPLGAGVAGIGVLLEKTIKAFIEMRQALSEEEAAVARAAEMQDKLTEALNGGLESALQAEEANESLKNSYNETTESIRNQVTALNERNRILDATDRADAAERDNKDAAAIRAGAAPEDVKAQRARDDAALAKKKIERDLEEKRLIEAERVKEKERVTATQDALERNPNATPEKIAEGRDTERKAAEAVEKAQRDRVVAEQIAEQRRREIDTSAAGKVSGFEADKARRLERERQAERERERRKEQESRRAELETQRDAAIGRLNDTASNASGVFGRAAAAGERRGVDPGVVKTLETARDKLANGTDENELSTIAAQVVAAIGSNKGATTEFMKSVLSEMQSQAQEIAAIQAQMKQSRAK